MRATRASACAWGACLLALLALAAAGDEKRVTVQEALREEPPEEGYSYVKVLLKLTGAGVDKCKSSSVMMGVKAAVVQVMKPHFELEAGDVRIFNVLKLDAGDFLVSTAASSTSLLQLQSSLRRARARAAAGVDAELRSLQDRCIMAVRFKVDEDDAGKALRVLSESVTDSFADALGEHGVVAVPSVYAGPEIGPSAEVLREEEEAAKKAAEARKEEEADKKEEEEDHKKEAKEEEKEKAEERKEEEHRRAEEAKEKAEEAAEAAADAKEKEEERKKEESEHRAREAEEKAKQQTGQ